MLVNSFFQIAFLQAQGLGKSVAEKMQHYSYSDRNTKVLFTVTASFWLSFVTAQSYFFYASSQNIEYYPLAKQASSLGVFISTVLKNGSVQIVP